MFLKTVVENGNKDEERNSLIEWILSGLRNCLVIKWTFIIRKMTYRQADCIKRKNVFCVYSEL